MTDPKYLCELTRKVVIVYTFMWENELDGVGSLTHITLKVMGILIFEQPWKQLFQIWKVWVT